MSTTTHEIEPGRLIDLSREVVGLDRSDGRARIVEQPSGRPPHRIDGVSIGAPMLTQDAPHAGEMHPDGDELLYLISGAFSVRLELPEGDRTVELATAGDAIVVPQGVWHLVSLREPGILLHITPGPHGDHRPLGGGPT
jgi:mannose-6-phosphate isomerase-like protein (cupin superfamily)